MGADPSRVGVCDRRVVLLHSGGGGLLPPLFSQKAMNNYPKWIYHATEPARIVANFEEHEAAGPKWSESPATEATAATAAIEAKPKKKKE